MRRKSLRGAVAVPTLRILTGEKSMKKLSAILATVVALGSATAAFAGGPATVIKEVPPVVINPGSSASFGSLGGGGVLAALLLLAVIAAVASSNDTEAS